MRSLFLGIPITADDVAETIPPLDVADAFDRRVAEASFGQLPDPRPFCATHTKKSIRNDPWHHPKVRNSLTDDFFVELFRVEMAADDFQTRMRVFNHIKSVVSASPRLECMVGNF